MPDNIVLVTGGFDPIHSGHISYLKEASKLGSKLIVGLNSDEWLTRKKGNYFLPFKERATILKSIKYVNKVISFDDTDDTANKVIGLARTFGKGKVIFANGGDREKNNVPEIDTWGSNPQVEFVFGVGGNKTNSSSKILADWQNNCVQTK